MKLRDRVGGTNARHRPYTQHSQHNPEYYTTVINTFQYVYIISYSGLALATYFTESRDVEYTFFQSTCRLHRQPIERAP